MLTLNAPCPPIQPANSLLLPPASAVLNATSSNHRGFLLYLSIDGALPSFVDVAPPNLAEPVLLPLLDGARSARLTLRAFNDSGVGPGSIVSLPLP